MNARHGARLAALFAAALAICGCGEPTVEAPPEAEKAAPVVCVHATAATLGDHVTLIGATEPLKQRVGRVLNQVEGRVTTILVRDAHGALEGQSVKAGQVLVQLDDRVVRQNREKTRLSMEEQSELKRQASIARETASVEESRLSKLRATPGPLGGIPLVAGNDLQKARLALQDAESKIRAAEIHERQLKSDLDMLDLQLEYYTLRAPIDGKLNTLQVSVGQFLAAGTQIAEVLDLSELDVLCYVAPSVVGRLAVDQPATLVAPEDTSGAGEAASGKVISISAQAHPDTGNVAVRLRFANKNLAWRAGVVAHVDVTVQADAERMVVPDACLIQDQEPPQLVIVTGAKKAKVGDKEVTTGKAKHVTAVLGVRDAKKHVAEVRELNDADGKPVGKLAEALIVSEGWPGLKDDDLVSIVPEESSEKGEKADKDDKAPASAKPDAKE